MHLLELGLRSGASVRVGARRVVVCQLLFVCDGLRGGVAGGARNLEVLRRGDEARDGSVALVAASGVPSVDVYAEHDAKVHERYHRHE